MQGGPYLVEFWWKVPEEHRASGWPGNAKEQKFCSETDVSVLRQNITIDFSALNPSSLSDKHSGGCAQRLPRRVLHIIMACRRNGRDAEWWCKKTEPVVNKLHEQFSSREISSFARPGPTIQYSTRGNDRYE